MNLIYIFVLLSIFEVSKGQNELCEASGNRPQIYEALRIENRVLLVTGGLNQKKEYFGINGFKYEGNDFKFDSIQKIKDMSKDIDEAFILFSINDPETTPTGFGPLKGVALYYKSYEKNMFNELKGFSFDLTEKFGIANKKEFYLDIHRYDPGNQTNTIHINYLFWKFPEEDTSKRMHSILVFPKSHLKRRLFAYYMEMPPRNQKKDSDPPFQFKRHLFVRERIDKYKLNETDWVIEDCQPSHIVNASFALNEFPVDLGAEESFDLIEFSNDNYFIQRLKVHTTEVSKHLKLVRNGSVAEIFKCPKQAINTIPSDSKANPLITNKDNDMKHKDSQQEMNLSKDPNNEGIRVSTTALSFIFCVIAVLSQIDFSFDVDKEKVKSRN